MQNNSRSILSSMLMPIPGMGNINILKEVKKMAINLLAHGLAVQISRGEDTEFFQREVMDTEKQLTQIETCNKVEQKNKGAFDLDLNERSMLKRGTGAPIVVHKRRHANEK